MYFDILNGFDNFGPLFDELFGQGEAGVWQEVLDGLKDDPKGPQIDLREELIKHLGQRVSMLTDYQLPITTTSERLLFAIEVKNAKAVAAAIEKLFKNDPTSSGAKRPGTSFGRWWRRRRPTLPEPDGRLRRRARRRPRPSAEKKRRR